MELPSTPADIVVSETKAKKPKQDVLVFIPARVRTVIDRQYLNKDIKARLEEMRSGKFIIDDTTFPLSEHIKALGKEQIRFSRPANIYLASACEEIITELVTNTFINVEKRVEPKFLDEETFFINIETIKSYDLIKSLPSFIKYNNKRSQFLTLTKLKATVTPLVLNVYNSSNAFINSLQKKLNAVPVVAVDTKPSAKPVKKVNDKVLTAVNFVDERAALLKCFAHDELLVFKSCFLNAHVESVLALVKSTNPAWSAFRNSAVFKNMLLQIINDFILHTASSVYQIADLMDVKTVSRPLVETVLKTSFNSGLPVKTSYTYSVVPKKVKSDKGVITEVDSLKYEKTSEFVGSIWSEWEVPVNTKFEKYKALADEEDTKVLTDKEYKKILVIDDEDDVSEEVQCK